MEFKIQKNTVGQWSENTYFLLNDREGWIIDPGDDFNALDEIIKDKNITLKGIINTHGHFDHLGAVSSFKEKYNLPFYIHPEDKRLVGQANLYRKLAAGEGFFKTPAIDHYLDHQTELEFGESHIRVVHIPGHTKGSVGFVIGNHLISGDLLFEDAIGRTDLPGGNQTSLKQSVITVLKNFRGYTIHPGHGNSFVISDDYATSILRKLNHGN